MRSPAIGTLLIALFGAVLIACGGHGPASPTPAPGPPPVVDPLRDAADAAGKLVGAAVQSSFLNDMRYSDVLSRHFNYVTAEYEMKWDPIELTQGVESFSGGDAIAGYAAARGMRLKGHALIWHGATPGWVERLSADDLKTAFARHIQSVASHYRGQVFAWDVVNEAVADDGTGLRDTVFRQKLGDGYIAEAFHLAHEADPQALLFYNDYGGEELNGKADRIYELVRDLQRQGVPIDGVGLQMHVSAASPPSESSIAANIRRLASLGLRVNISEMDVRIRDLPGPQANRLETQRSVYHSIVGVCVSEPACDAVTFWGFTDAHSWIDSFFGADDPLLFDDRYAPKPAFFGVLDAFLRP